MATAAFAWMTVKHLSSNAIAIAADRQLLGVGAGQVDRVGACRTALAKADGRHRKAGSSVAASDAFFPFDDGPRLLIEAGVTCLVQPGGSKRDADTLADATGQTAHGARRTLRRPPGNPARPAPARQLRASEPELLLLEGGAKRRVPSHSNRRPPRAAGSCCTR